MYIVWWSLPQLVMAESNQMESEDDEEQPAPLLAICGRFFPFSEDGIPFGGRKIIISERSNQANTNVDGGTAFNVWDGALLLARYLEKSPDIVRDKIVLELGSGCGLVGICCSVLDAKEVVMTDLEYALPLMEENVERNVGKDLNHQSIKCKACDWYKPQPISELCENSDEPDVILVADCVWLNHLISPLIHTLKTYAGDYTKVIITYQQRGKDSHEFFMQCIHDIFDVEVIDTEKTVGLAKPDVFYVLECSKKKSST